MTRNRIDEEIYDEIARSVGVSSSEVKRAVTSFFGSISLEAGRLPFDNPRKIYTKSKFDEFSRVWNIPSVGRLGPVYSRYIKWRGNAAKEIEQRPRREYRSRVTREDIERLAEEILSGRKPTPIRKKKKKELFNSVWLVGKESKKLARQVIPKKKSDVQD